MALWVGGKWYDYWLEYSRADYFVQCHPIYNAFALELAYNREDRRGGHFKAHPNLGEPRWDRELLYSRFLPRMGRSGFMMVTGRNYRYMFTVPSWYPIALSLGAWYYARWRDAHRRRGARFQSRLTLRRNDLGRQESSLRIVGHQNFSMNSTTRRVPSAWGT